MERHSDRFPNDSRAPQSEADVLTDRDRLRRLARELSKLDVKEENELAEEGVGEETWPAY